MTDSIDNHPIFNNSQFFIETLMQKKLQEQITRCLWNGVTGAAVYGSFRIGKTRALRSLCDQFINSLGENIPAKMVSIAPRDVGTVAGVFKNICLSLGFELKKRVTADDMSNLILHHLGELSLSNSTNQVILIVDELQRLNINQFEAFAELYDRLSMIEKNLFVLFAGNQSGSSKMIKSIKKSKRCELIRGRFFTQEFKFYGIRTYEELKQCLSQYDESHYPDDGPSYTQYLLKGIVKASWRLDSLADLIWSEYQESFNAQLNIESWPMQYFVSMVRILLADFLPRYGVDDLDINRSLIHEAINLSGLVESLVK